MTIEAPYGRRGGEYRRGVSYSPPGPGTEPRPKTIEFWCIHFRAWKSSSYSDSDKFDIFDTFAVHILSHSQLLNIKLHLIYISPCYTAKTVVKFLSRPPDSLWLRLWVGLVAVETGESSGVNSIVENCIKENIRRIKFSLTVRSHAS